MIGRLVYNVRQCSTGAHSSLFEFLPRPSIISSPPVAPLLWHPWRPLLYHDDVAWRSKCIVYILFRSVDVIAAKKTTTGRRPTCYNKKPSSYISAAGHVLYDKRTKSVSFFISYIFWPSLLGLKCFGGWFYVIYRRTNGSTLSFGRLFMWYVPSPPPLYYIGPPHPILR